MIYDDIDYSDLEPVCALYDGLTEEERQEAREEVENYLYTCPLNSDTLGIFDRDFF